MNDRYQNPQQSQHYGPFFKPDGSLILDWVGKKAQEFSSDVLSARNGLTSTGLRNFYNEFIRIRSLPEGHVEEKKILIKLLVAKVNYKMINGKAPEIFSKFVTALVEEIGEDLDRFEKACLVMEAIVGFNPKK